MVLRSKFCRFGAESYFEIKMFLLWGNGSLRGTRHAYIVAYFSDAFFKHTLLIPTMFFYTVLFYYKIYYLCKYNRNFWFLKRVKLIIREKKFNITNIFKSKFVCVAGTISGGSARRRARASGGWRSGHTRPTPRITPWSSSMTSRWPAGTWRRIPYTRSAVCSGKN